MRAFKGRCAFLKWREPNRSVSAVCTRMLLLSCLSGRGDLARKNSLSLLEVSPIFSTRCSGSDHCICDHGQHFEYLLSRGFCRGNCLRRYYCPFLDASRKR